MSADQYAFGWVAFLPESPCAVRHEFKKFVRLFLPGPFHVELTLELELKRVQSGYEGFADDSCRTF